MSAKDFLEELKAKGISLSVEGNSINAAGPLNDALIKRIRFYKKGLIRAIQSEPAMLDPYTLQAGPVTISRVKDGYELSFRWDADFIEDLKAIPYHARKWDKDKKIWWIEELYMPLAADFIASHYDCDPLPLLSQLQPSPFPFTLYEMSAAEPYPYTIANRDALITDLKRVYGEAYRIEF